MVTGVRTPKHLQSVLGLHFPASQATHLDRVVASLVWVTTGDPARWEQSRGVSSAPTAVLGMPVV